jgi:hypothetical protein
MCGCVEDAIRRRTESLPLFGDFGLACQPGILPNHDAIPNQQLELSGTTASSASLMA